VNSDSKIIYDRTPRERVQKAAPWLKADGDPYPAVVDGRIVWIVDGYTTSNSYPYAQRVGLNAVTSDAQTTAQGTNVVAQPDTNINYIRNSVKATRVAMPVAQVAKALSPRNRSSPARIRWRLSCARSPTSSVDSRPRPRRVRIRSR